MRTHAAKLVTIICEAYALEPVKRLFREIGAHGWTHFPVEGSGESGERTGEMMEFGNVQIEVVLDAASAEALLGRLERDFFPRYGMIVTESDVRVLRADKFRGG
jgi:nitrogen regulatory protein PII